MDTFGRKLRKLRKEQRLTQAELAKGIVTPSMISQIESDRITPSQTLLKQLAAKLKVDVAEFKMDVSQQSDFAHTYRRARQLIEESKYREALPLLHAISFPMALQFKAEILYNDLAQCYQMLGQLSEAAEMFELVVQAALEKDEVATAIHAYYHLGTLERRRHNTPFARMYWQRANELINRYPKLNMPIGLRIRANLGRIYREEQRFETALACFESAAILAENYAAPLELAIVYHGLSHVHTDLKDFNEAIRYNDKAWTAYDYENHSRGINQCKINEAFILRCSGQHTEAIDKLTKYIRAYEFQDDAIRHANAFGERAQNLVKMNRYQEALEDAKSALSLDKDNLMLHREMHLVRAECFYQEEKFEQVLVEISKGNTFLKESDPQNRIRFERLERRALEKLGRHQHAQQCVVRFAISVLNS